ncbi:Hypothetical protein NCS54_01231500 [Fusarium falciforme]|uniref:Hypothetical protein n=1 Tax=Fusarium falciforme TaxID=195108 RepID=UPI0023010992|nr:Hypothetical protein NCS54_01231500 [Fusarium falciforme]WAO94719.1 Hypothetical protein NCS54_01231500 [Fusarium falciforme]
MSPYFSSTSRTPSDIHLETVRFTCLFPRSRTAALIMGSRGVAAAGPDVPTVDSVDLESDQLTEVRRLLFGAESAAPPRKRRRGGKVYSGCGTCRTRKIKCDERRPKCHNCERSRIYMCDGYENTSGASSAFPIGHDVLDWSQIGSLAHASGAIRHQDGSAGPGGEGETAHWEALGDIMNIFSWSPTVERRPASPDQSDESERRDDGLDNDAPPHSGPITPVELVQQPRLPLSITDSVIASEVTQKLIDHYRTRVCELMMPTSAPSNNPWLQVYLPLALRQPPSLPQQILLHAILAVAAFNRSYLASTTSVVDRKRGQEHYGRAMALLRTALDSPDSSSVLGHETSARHALMASALTLTTVEVFSGASGGDGYQHLLLCKRVIELTGGLESWLSDPTCLTLLQIFRCYRIVAETSGRLDVLQGPPDWLPLHDSVSESLEKPPDSSTAGGMAETVAITGPTGTYSLDVTFGISAKTLHYLSQISTFARIKSKLGPDETWPPDCVPDLLRLEADLCDSLDNIETFIDAPSPDSNPLRGTSGYIADVIKENHMLTFQYSASIFFRRALCDGSSRISPPAAPGLASDASVRPSGQTLVSKALDYLENIDAVSRNIAVANTLWPGFIAAVEAVDTDLRHRALIWFARAKRHGIGNVSQAVSLVMEVWRRVDRQFINHGNQDGLQLELGSVDWREVMREKNMYIMLT